MKILKWFLFTIGVLIAAAGLYLLVVAVIPGFEVPEQPLKKVKQEVSPPLSESSSLRKNVSFTVKGLKIKAWLYKPPQVSESVPCIIMASGLGGTKDMGLDSYAMRFRESGFAVLVFDYRYFGESQGEPRQLIWILYQLEDWTAAIDYARGLPGIDQKRIGLWGTSLSGGHVLEIAASDKKIACVSAQCPGVDGRASAELAFEKFPFGYNLRMLMHGQRDLVRSWLGLSPHKVPIVGKPNSIALMAFSEAYEAFNRLAPNNFINEACARIIIRGDKYRPIKKANLVRCPVLLQICEKDEILSTKSIEKTGRILGQFAEIRRYPIGHFDIYFGENFEMSVKDQITFFKKHL